MAAIITVWKNGNLLTMKSGGGRATALVVRGEELLFVGDEAGARSAAGPQAEVRDLRGRTVIPGFNDNHVHTVFMGDHALAPDLAGLGEAEILELLAQRFPTPAPGEVIRAYDWDYTTCPDPRKETLDRIFPRTPVVLSQHSGHAQWLNSAALRAIGVLPGGLSPYGEQVLRDEAGEPTGIVRDLGETPLSRRRVRECFYDASKREKRIDHALGVFGRLGITSVQDNAWYYPQLLGLRRRHAEGRLSARFSLWSLGTRPRVRMGMDAAFALAGGVPDWILRGPVKYFLDGTFSTRNACLHEPFLDTPASAPLPQGKLPIRELEFLARSGRQGAFHAIGDRAVTLFLDAYEEVLARRPKLGELRTRIEHAQLIRPQDIQRIARLGVLVSAQPTALGTPQKDEALLGRERARRAYPYRSLLEAGVHLSFGSDIPGESGCDPFQSIHWAVNRDSPEAIDVEEALRCYTAGSAYAEFAEGRVGTLEPGKLADFVVLSQDPTAVPREKLRDTTVELTVVGGRVVYDAASTTGLA